MANTPLIIQQTINAHVDKVWKAITERDQMAKWYFDLKEFEPEIGFKFTFLGGSEDGKKYLHACEIKEVIPEQKISYTWRYDGYAGNSLVTFTLSSLDQGTVVTLTHEGLDSFPADVADLDRKNFEAGWTSLIRTSLKTHLEE